MKSSITIKSIRQKYAEDFRKKLATGQIASPIRDLAIMMGECQREARAQKLKLRKFDLVNLTIGDVEPRFFHVDGDKNLANELGLDPFGTVRKKINERILELRKLAWKTGTEPRTGYQPEALGMPLLREKFVEFINSYGFDYSVGETVIQYGSLPGIHAVLEGVRTQTQGKAVFVAPTPGFSVFYTQAKRLGLQFLGIQSQAADGYCCTPQALEATLTKIKTLPAILYLSPMNNPTSTVYNRATLAATLQVFQRMQPAGIILVDLAYLEMIPKSDALQLLRLFKTTHVLDQSIMVTSISKMFGYPRLRCAALLMKNPQLMKLLQDTAQVDYASISSGVELEGVALWEIIKPGSRKKMFALFQKRQQALLRWLQQINETREKNHQSPVVALNQAYTQVPLYVYIKLAPGVNFLDFFVETGICGVSGSVFGDIDQNNMLRLAVGIEPLANLSREPEAKT